MQLTAAEIAELVGGEVHGDSETPVSHAAPVHQATSESLTYAANAISLEALEGCPAAVAVLKAEKVTTAAALNDSVTLVAVPGDVEEAFLLAAHALHPRREKPEIGISPAAHVAPSASIGHGTNLHPQTIISDDACVGHSCHIYPGAYVGRGVRIGNHVTLHPNAVIYDDVIIGNNCTIHSNAVIGADGFGYRTVNGEHVRIPHLGTVRIEDDVEIGAGTTIDRAKVGSTIIGRGTKIDNLVMIGHNCELGRHNVLASQVGFAGSASTGDYVICGGQVGVADHVHLGAGSVYAAKCGAHRDMKPGETYMGTPAAPVVETRKQLMAIRKLPAMRTTLRGVERQLKELQALIEAKHSAEPAVTSPPAAPGKAA